ncbi:conserved Plasmodium protein, unknown function [Plasmodium ovale]|uniref:Uncharacterized protein n=1 Tax=Plasmodium ovale TaxID=36330 RepID=A0A1C3L5F1_PLAOA|nr:conserved Plasmodium protein, unknown function [Plasmodium ovale]
MLDSVHKIKYLQQILYREKSRKKKKKCWLKNWFNNGMYNEKVSFLYKNKRLLQIIEFSRKENSLFIPNCNWGKNEENPEIRWSSIKPSKVYQPYCNPSAGGVNRYEKHTSKRGYTGNDTQCILTRGRISKEDISNTLAEEYLPSDGNTVYSPSPLWKNKSLEEKNATTVERYMEKKGKIEGKKNKLVIRYEIGSVPIIVTILNKCKEYKYENCKMFDDMCHFLQQQKEGTNENIENLIQIANGFIKCNYFNEGFFDYLFMYALCKHTLSNENLVSLLHILSNVKKVKAVHALFIYKINYAILHRFFSFSIYQLYNLLNAYQKIEKNIDKEFKKGEITVNPYEKWKDPYENFLNKRWNEKIHSEDFKTFYHLRFGNGAEESNQRRDRKRCISFVFSLVNCLRKNKVTMGELERVVNARDCLNEPVFSYIKGEMGIFFIRKVKSEYVIFNRDERKRLYKRKDVILQRVAGGKDVSMGRMVNPVEKKNDGRVKRSEIIQLRLIKKMKKKVNARIFIPFINIHNEEWKICQKNKNNEEIILSLKNKYIKKIEDFFHYSYKHMYIKFDKNSLLITFSCFSKKRQLLNDDILQMLTNIIEKKITYFNSEQVIKFMNNYSNLKNKNIKNNIFNFFIRFLYNNNNIIYLKDKHINILVNIIINKIHFINEDVIKFVNKFLINHKPYYKNKNNIYSYLFFNFYFSILNREFINSLYYSITTLHILYNFKHVNILFSSCLVISNCNIYLRKIFKIINVSALYMLKNILFSYISTSEKYIPSYMFIKDLNHIVDFIFYANSSMTNKIFKGTSKDIKKRIKCKKYSFMNPNPTTLWKKMSLSISRKKNDHTNSVYFMKKRNKILLYYSFNSYGRIYLMTSSLNIKIFILIKKCIHIFLKKHWGNVTKEIATVLVKALTNLHEMQNKTIQIKKRYTYFYIAKNGICRKNRITNEYFLKITSDIKKFILLFLSQCGTQGEFFSRFAMVKWGLLFTHDKKQVLHAYQDNTAKHSSCNLLTLMHFSSSYKLGEVALSERSITCRENYSTQDEERKGSFSRVSLDSLEGALIETFLKSQKLERPQDKREKLISLIYNEKKRKKSSTKNAIKNFLYAYKCTHHNYLEKYRYQKNVYMNRIITTMEKKFLKRKIKKFDDQVKVDYNFKNVCKYNKFLLRKIWKKWKKKKEFLILKSRGTSGYLDSSDLVEALLSAVVMSLRNAMRSGNLLRDNYTRVSNSYEKLVLFLLSRMIVLKKPKLNNVHYPLYFKFILCINVLKYIFPKLYQMHAHILMYWKKIFRRNVGGGKTFRNYFDYVKSGQVNPHEHFSFAGLPPFTGSSTSRGTKNEEIGKSTNVTDVGDVAVNRAQDDIAHFLNYPCISQTGYKYKLRDNNYYSFEDSFYFKKSDKYKNVVHHSMYDEYRYVQNSAHKLYSFLIYLCKRLVKKKKERRKKKRKIFPYNMNSQCGKKKSLLLRVQFRILSVKKMDLFHNHVIRVDVKKDGSSNVNTFCFFVYSPFNVNKIVENDINAVSRSGVSTNETLRRSEQIFFKREIFLSLFLIKIRLHKKIPTGFRLIPVCSEELNSIHHKIDMYLYLLRKMR